MERRFCADPPPFLETPLGSLWGMWMLSQMMWTSCACLASRLSCFLHAFTQLSLWHLLVCLLKGEILPMSERGLEVLDIGTGPAPALYATYDFYQALQNFANEKGYSSLVTPLPNLSSVESSLNMAHFMHRFSEISERTSGPYSPTFRDFDRLNFAELRAKERWARIEREMDEQDTSEKYAKWFVSQMFPTDHLYHYNLVILSNFLTEKSKVEGWREELLSTFLTDRHGGIAVVVGGSAEKYQPAYDIVTEV